MIYSMYAGDQSACPECREKVQRKLEKSDNQRALDNLRRAFERIQFQWRG